MKPSSVMIACSLLLFFIIGWPSAIAGKFSICFFFHLLNCLVFFFLPVDTPGYRKVSRP